MSKNLVQANWVNDRLNELVIIDCRFHLGNPEKGLSEYRQNHISGAIYFDLEKDLSSNVETHGGRHPLPDLENFTQKLRESGVSNNSIFVVYDDQAGAMASRVWWMLKYVGHDQVFVLNGGYSNWLKQRYPTSSQIPEPRKSDYECRVNNDLLVSMSEVKSKLDDNKVLLIDSRSKERFDGVEPIDAIGGHIPGAFQEDWQDRTDADGNWKDLDNLKRDLDIYVNADKEVIIYCGSGVTACVNILALSELGAEPKLYAGSWSDWISYKENPINTIK
ncbi:sulfurtransferase [Salipaludibacillus sp. HK11]|uniref:sulfurtransferase n=1 Tax=Salipaludibacillus sp. HK11 TaxID=3394320 RepID=UPI0039FD35D2